MSPTSRRLLVALIIVAIIVVAVVAALVVSGDDSEGAEAGSAVLLPAESIESTEAPSATEDDAPSRTPSEVEAAIDECRFRADGYSIRGTVSGGGQLVARYEVTVAVVDGDGEAYAEVTERVVPSDDRARPADFEASVPLAADEVRDDSACEVVDAEPLRIAPR